MHVLSTTLLRHDPCTDWEKADRDYDVEEGKKLVDAAKAVGVQHFIWS